MLTDILGIQISTVASESTFSTGRRVITDYRSNLSVGIVEALICTADWTRKSRMPIMDNVDDILNDDDVAIGLYFYMVFYFDNVDEMLKINNCFYLFLFRTGGSYTQ